MQVSEDGPAELLYERLTNCNSGALLGFAGACTLSVNASPWYLENAPGLLRMIGAMVFPLGLIMIVLTGADLFTGTNMVRRRPRHDPRKFFPCAATDKKFQYTAVAALDRRISVWKMLMHWFICFWGNLAGALFLMAIIFGCKSLPPDFRSWPILLTCSCSWWRVRRRPFPQLHPKICAQEASRPRVPSNISQGHRMQLVGLLGLLPRHARSLSCFQGHWLVVADIRLCLAWPGPRCGQHVHHPHGHLAGDTRRHGGHVHLERYESLLPLCLVTFANNSLSRPAGIIPAALGNIIGGALFCGTYYWWMFSFGAEPIPVDGQYYDSYSTTTLPIVNRSSKTERGRSVGSDSATVV